MPDIKKNANLVRAKVRREDEFFTRREDIERELIHYPDAFCGKAVYCCADDPEKSAFWAFFHENFQKLGLRRLTATFHPNDQRPATCTVYEGGADQDLSAGTCCTLHGDGDFLGTECQQLLEKNDLVCTNPPFSLFREFLTAIGSRKKEFLLIGNMNAVTAKTIFPAFQKDQIRLGSTSPQTFLRPDGTKKKFGNVVWFTNIQLDRFRQRPFLNTGKRLEDGQYPSYANCEGIDVPRVTEIPDDYMGIMGVPITFMKYYNPDQFQILGYSKHAPDNRIPIQNVPEGILNSFRSQGGTGHYTTGMRVLCYYDGEGKGHFPFERILIRRRQTIRTQGCTKPSDPEPVPDKVQVEQETLRAESCHGSTSRKPKKKRQAGLSR